MTIEIAYLTWASGFIQSIKKIFHYFFTLVACFFKKFILFSDLSNLKPFYPAGSDTDFHLHFFPLSFFIHSELPWGKTKIKKSVAFASSATLSTFPHISSALVRVFAFPSLGRPVFSNFLAVEKPLQWWEYCHSPAPRPAVPGFLEGRDVRETEIRILSLPVTGCEALDNSISPSLTFTICKMG